jgi:hypothetical protein
MLRLVLHLYVFPQNILPPPYLCHPCDLPQLLSIRLLLSTLHSRQIVLALTIKIHIRALRTLDADFHPRSVQIR